MYKKIKLNHEQYALVDIGDYKELNKFKWRYNTTGYATRTSRNISMSRVIMCAKNGEYIDHINGNKLDNRRKNLRIVNNQQNSWNNHSNKRPFVGVSFIKSVKKWRAYINIDKKQIHLGRYEKLTEAVKARNNGVKKYFGEFGNIQKIKNNV